MCLVILQGYFRHFLPRPAMRPTRLDWKYHQSGEAATLQPRYPELSHCLSSFSCKCNCTNMRLWGLLRIQLSLIVRNHPYFFIVGIEIIVFSILRNKSAFFVLAGRRKPGIPELTGRQDFHSNKAVRAERTVDSVVGPAAPVVQLVLTEVAWPVLDQEHRN